MVGLILLGVLGIVFGGAVGMDWRGRHRNHRPWAGREVTERRPEARFDLPDTG